MPYIWVTPEHCYEIRKQRLGRKKSPDIRIQMDLWMCSDIAQTRLSSFSIICKDISLIQTPFKLIHLWQIKQIKHAHLLKSSYCWSGNQQRAFTVAGLTLPITDFLQVHCSYLEPFLGWHGLSFARLHLCISAICARRTFCELALAKWLAFI